MFEFENSETIVPQSDLTGSLNRLDQYISEPLHIAEDIGSGLSSRPQALLSSSVPASHLPPIDLPALFATSMMSPPTSTTHNTRSPYSIDHYPLSPDGLIYRHVDDRLGRIVLEHGPPLIRGAARGFMGTIYALTHPYREIIEPAGLFLHDTQVIGARELNNANLPYILDPIGGIEMAQMAIRQDPHLVTASEIREQLREEQRSLIYNAFVNGSSTQRTEMVAQVAAAFLTQGCLINSLKIASNFHRFRCFRNPVSYHSNLKLLPDELELINSGTIPLLTHNEITKLPGLREYVYGVTEEGGLTVAPRFVPRYREGVGYHEIKHSYLTLGGKLLGAGQFYTYYGRVIYITNQSGRYLTTGSHVKNLVERTFVRHGYLEAHYHYYQRNAINIRFCMERNT